ncbi:SCP2 domain-containing protein [Aliikangiella sp. G2MR2-5]|uniref:ubiquinone biosynthesis accessory factor UbiJ n=1 Tax=Aliikangiella sp. G2MR2-5 TaxID=2788943 RepID=UPI0018AB9E48|nr:SCP2 sterol-binding domain-containing protein [Aliikangiella sp. G2MR2-5]
MIPVNRITSALAEQIGNRILALDCEAASQLEQFAGKTIHLEISDLGLQYYLRFPNGTMVITESSTQPVSASISGKASAFLGAATADHSGDSIFTGDLHFSGEIKTAQRFQKLLEGLDPDWQKPIADKLGDEISALVSRGVSQLHNLVQNAIVQTKQDIPEYLQEEIKVTPGKYEIGAFFEEVDNIRSQVDRLAARITRLKNK